MDASSASRLMFERIGRFKSKRTQRSMINRILAISRKASKINVKRDKLEMELELLKTEKNSILQVLNINFRFV